MSTFLKSYYNICRKLSVWDLDSKAIGKNTISHNKKGLKDLAVVRSLALIKPLSSIEHLGVDSDVLTIGPRTEGEILSIIGYGFMGKATAKRFAAIGANVIAYDKYLSDYSDQIVKEASLQEVFELADIVSLHVPLTNETDYFYDDRFFKSFSNDIVFHFFVKNLFLVKNSIN